MIRTMGQLYMEVTGGLLDMPALDAEKERILNGLIQNDTNGTVRLCGDPQGVECYVSDPPGVLARHYLYYPFKRKDFLTTINFLEGKAATARNALLAPEDEVYIDEKILPCPECGMTLDPESPSGHIDPTAAPCVV